MNIAPQYIHQHVLDLLCRPPTERPPIYGMVIQEDQPNPTQRVTYLADNRTFTPLQMDLQHHTIQYGSWSTFSWLRRNLPVMCDFDGHIDYILDPADYTRHWGTTTPSDIANPTYPGQAMAVIPKLYSVSYHLGSERYFFLCEEPVSPLFQAIGFQVDGIERDYMLIPMFYGSVDEQGRIRSLAGQWSAGTISGTAAQNRYGIDMDVRAQAEVIASSSPYGLFFGGPLVNVLTDLAILLSHSTDSQTAYGRGVSQIATTDADCSGHWGTCPNPLLHHQFYGGCDGRTFTNLFHSTVLGSYMLWQRDPYLLCDHGHLKVTVDYRLDLTGKSQIETGTILNSSGAFSKTYDVDQFGSIPISESVSTYETGYCDQIYSSGTVMSFCSRFGCCRSGTRAGLHAKSMNHAAYNRGWNRDGLPLEQATKIDQSFSWWWNFGCSLMLPAPVVPCPIRIEGGHYL